MINLQMCNKHRNNLMSNEETFKYLNLYEIHVINMILIYYLFIVKNRRLYFATLLLRIFISRSFTVMQLCELLCGA